MIAGPTHMNGSSQARTGGAIIWRPSNSTEPAVGS